MTTKYDYYVRRLGPTEFEVAKFIDFDGDQPVSVYKVTWNSKTGKGSCDCPAATYRGTGINDKHIQLVKGWVANGDSFQKVQTEK